MPVMKPSTPPLLEGDHLDQETFHRRYESMPPATRAQLIGGVVHIAGPVGWKHAKNHALIMTLLGRYQAETPGTIAAGPTTVVLADDSEPEPDASLRLEDGATGVYRYEGEEYVAGPPELVAEIATDTESVDLHAKRRDYEKYGVGEYIAFLIRTRSVVWLVREGKKFVGLKPGADGILRSKKFPGLWLDPAALVGGDKRRVNEVLQQGLASPEHARFVTELAKHNT